MARLDLVEVHRHERPIEGQHAALVEQLEEVGERARVLAAAHRDGDLVVRFD